MRGLNKVYPLYLRVIAILRVVVATLRHSGKHRWRFTIAKPPYGLLYLKQSLVMHNG